METKRFIKNSYWFKNLWFDFAFRIIFDKIGHLYTTHSIIQLSSSETDFVSTTNPIYFVSNQYFMPLFNSLYIDIIVDVTLSSLLLCDRLIVCVHMIKFKQIECFSLIILSHY